MIYELRVYQPVPGRMPALLARFRDKTVAIWEKHGIRAVGFWTTLIGESSNKLTYMLAWESLADRGLAALAGLAGRERPLAQVGGVGTRHRSPPVGVETIPTADRGAGSVDDHAIRSTRADQVAELLAITRRASRIGAGQYQNRERQNLRA